VTEKPPSSLLLLLLLLLLVLLWCGCWAWLLLLLLHCRLTYASLVNYKSSCKSFRASMLLSLAIAYQSIITAPRSALEIESLLEGFVASTPDMIWNQMK